MARENNLELRVDGYTHLLVNAENGTAYSYGCNILKTELVFSYKDADDLLDICMRLAGKDWRDVEHYAGLMHGNLKFEILYRKDTGWGFSREV